MGRKLKFAVIALLGFSTACSSAKKSQKSTEPEIEAQPAEVVPRIKVMYGVRSPYPVTSVKEIKTLAADSVALQSESPAIEDDNSANNE